MLRRATLPIAAAFMLVGCSAGGTSMTPVVRAPQIRPATPTPPLDQQFASVSLDDSQLGAIRGGFVLSAGTELRFAFQEATYVNRNLVQNLVSPMVTLRGGAGAMPVLTANTGPIPMPPSTLDVRGQGTGVLALSGNTPFGGIMGSGMLPSGLSITSMGNVGGLTNFITNTLNGQLVQQATRVDISISGLNGLQQPSLALPVLDALRGAQMLPR